MRLTDSQLINVIDKTPLVSIDLIIRDPGGNLLMGLRTNEPAKGEWFVPGGRILKNEKVEDAFTRITKKELGKALNFEETRLLNVFNHIYQTNYLEKDDVNTHYVVLAYEIFAPKNQLNALINSPDEQHKELKWISLKDSDKMNVHVLSKVYYEINSDLSETQYEILNSRRDSFNNLVWQTPVLSLTAQAFLFTIIYTSTASNVARTIVAALSIILALASIQLLLKHRFMEAEHAKFLHTFEKTQNSNPINRRMLSSNKIIAISSYKVWLGALLAVLFGALVSIPLIWLNL